MSPYPQLIKINELTSEALKIVFTCGLEMLNQCVQEIDSEINNDKYETKNDNENEENDKNQINDSIEESQIKNPKGKTNNNDKDNVSS